jgi:hypothetical protein
VISVEDILSSISAMELMWEPLHAKLKSEVSRIVKILVSDLRKNFLCFIFCVSVIMIF